MKSYGVTIQMKPLQQYFHMLLFIFKYFPNEIWDSSLILILGTLGSERVKGMASEALHSAPLACDNTDERVIPETFVTGIYMQSILHLSLRVGVSILSPQRSVRHRLHDYL